MSKKPLPSPELLRKLLRYEPLTGKLFWRKRGVEWFKKTGRGGCQGEANRWNARWADKEAFTAINDDGYRHGVLLGKYLRAQRVIWAMETGEWPDDEVDHEDRDRANNRFGNLRLVTRIENMKNTGMPKNNTSGFTGVSWRKQTNKWHAKIGLSGESVHLGYFSKRSDAIAARKAANVKYGFHKNHGR